MSRSYKKTPVCGLTRAESDQPWKAEVARKTRRIVHQRLRETLDGDTLPEKRWAVVNPWDAPKDGKQWLTEDRVRWMRK